MYKRQTQDGRELELPSVATTDWLLPGQSESFELVFDIPEGPEVTSIVVSASVDDDGAGGQQYNECDEENNTADSNSMSCPTVQ